MLFIRQAAEQKIPLKSRFTMWDLKSIINQCVKCKSKFTSAEKPLKLLPCLHSMCLDCLCGRTPVRRPSESTPAENKAEAEKDQHESDLGEQESSKTASEISTEKKDKECEDKENDAAETVSTDDKHGESLAKDSDESECGRASSDEVVDDPEKEDSVSKDDPPPQTNTPGTCVESDGGTKSKSEVKKEIVETKPKPVTGKNNIKNCFVRFCHTFRHHRKKIIIINNMLFCLLACLKSPS